MKKIHLFFLSLCFGSFLNAQIMPLDGTETIHAKSTSKDTIKSPDEFAAFEEVNQTDERLLRKNAKKKKADKLNKKLGYMKSVDLYQEIRSDKHIVTPSMMVGLANSYRMNGETEAAEYWYAQYMQYTDEPEDFLHYAQALQSNGKCQDAVRWYKKYQKVQGRLKMTFIKNCEDLEEFNFNPGVVVKNVKSLNTPQLDFSPMPYNNEVIFTSNRGIERMIVYKDSWTQQHFTDLFTAEKTGDYEFGEARPLAGDTNNKFHDGTATFSPDGATMIFTRNNQKNKSSRNIINLQLMSARNDDGEWVDVQALPFNSKEWNNCHPALSPDGMSLYFASDQPGGFGMMDIYVSKNVDGKWEEPMLLGPEINTEGNELFPYVDKKGVLYFSSNGHKGIGGLDVFSVKQSKKGNDNTWSKRKNLGYKINSFKDDFGFVKNDVDTTGWLTSNRPGGKGGDDIYYWEMHDLKEKPVYKTICVKDGKTGKILSSTIINVIKTPFSASFEENWQTDRKGTFIFPVIKGESYGMTATKKGYEEQSVVLSARELIKAKEYCIEMKPLEGVLLKGKVLIAAYESLLPGAVIVLYNHCTEKTERFISNELGAFEFRLDCECEYDIFAEKVGLKGKKQSFTITPEHCEAGHPIEKVLKLDFDRNPSASNTKPYTNTEKPYNNTKPSASRMNSYRTPLTNSSISLESSLTTGTIIRLDDLYYDYNEAHIRSEAAAELDKVVALMKKYPSLEIEMRSHTDSRGTKEYNEDLSHRRARSAAQYLLARGIQLKRVIARGYGESLLVNECDDDVSCNDRKHQENRRTEIKITYFNENDLKGNQ